MGESVKSGSRLELSVSFGRFENDALSWEKWSSFSPNKYLEEVGSLSTPGSVAQKKAYFEAHYKKIAAKKAEQLEKQNSMEHVPTGQDEPTITDHLENSSGRDVDAELETSEDSLVARENYGNAFTNGTVVDKTKDDVVVEHQAWTDGLIDVTPSEEEKVDDATAMESQNTKVQDAMEEFNDLVIDREFNFSEEAASEGEQIPVKDSIVEHPPKSQSGVAQLTQLKKEASKINPRNIPKVIPTKSERKLAAAKKVILPAAKPLQSSTTKSSNAAIVSPLISSSQSAKKMVTKSTLPKNKNFLMAESQRSAPTSLHMSLSLGHANSSAALSTTRKSLIMEKMGDKDIVKRAFKSFHNQINGYSSVSSALHQGKLTPFEAKNLPSPSPRKENKWLRNASDKLVAPRNKLEHQLKPFPSGSCKISLLDRKNTMAISQFIGMKTDEKSEKRKEFGRSLEAKSIVRREANARLNTKSKEEKESEIGKLRQNLNFKATPLPSFYNRGHGKGHSEKEVAADMMTTHHLHASKKK